LKPEGDLGLSPKNMPIEALGLLLGIWLLLPPL
jgi:hypothetical protein